MAGPLEQVWRRQQVIAQDKPVDSNAGTILAITATMMGLSFIVVALRCWIRQVMLKSFNIDDAVMVVALGMAIGCMTCFIGMAKNGAGRFAKDILPEWQQGLAYWSYIIGIFQVTGISLVKISIAFFLRRFVQTKWQRHFTMVLLIFCAVFMIYSILTFVLACIPLSALWKITPSARCWSKDTLGLLGTVNGVINVTTDLIFVILPIPVVIKLQVNRRTKITLVAILSLGLFACVASVARMIYAYEMFADPNYTRNYNFLIWFNVELHAGILSASLPALRPLFAKILQNTSRHLRTRGYNYGSRYGNRYGNQSGNTHTRSGYRRQDDIPMDTRNFAREDGYNAQVSTASAKILGDDGSEGGILPPKGGISKRTEIIVQEARDGPEEYGKQVV
ncbi:uncharacterized protein BCR38DRAFT_72093 [Pseudomassariella vexata]|uniref:Rhodopsin domain-containing protein n=1 Tax=Pseudomassariella vexata TaxID=1141098 RepID=A0A1Y2DIF1_9PEZI|nr:uncharacterized protein BCR38DRAFT_72093 [Pseudomassariella vexata]ORY58914.1 hypothetical protein BCR38DRAFT_72093 [Pseudomassariella vexata]